MNKAIGGTYGSESSDETETTETKGEKKSRKSKAEKSAASTAGDTTFSESGAIEEALAERMGFDEGEAATPKKKPVVAA